MNFQGLTVAAQLVSLQRSQWWRASKIRKYQDSELVSMLRYAATSVGYYRDLGIGVSDISSAADLQRFPVLTKGVLQSNRDSLLSDGAALEACMTSSTSGSTGEPTTTAFDERSWLMCKYALKIRRLLAFGVGLGKRVVLVSELRPDELGGDPASRSMGRGLLYGQRQISIHQPVKDLVPLLRSFRPHALYAFPSYLAELLEYCQTHGVVLPKLDVVFTSSEILGNALRDRLAEAFGAVICDVYGCTEFKEVAWQCGEKRYHINFESTWVETVDDGDGDGSGTLLLTTLVNRAMPLIRYRVGDRGRLGSGPCPCGREGPWMEIISGRENDMLLLPDGRRLSPYLLTSVIETDPAVRRYQIAQVLPGRLEVRYISPTAHAVGEKALSCTLLDLVGAEMQIHFQRVHSIPRMPSGKQSVFVREFDSDVDK